MCFFFFSFFVKTYSLCKYSINVFHRQKHYHNISKTIKQNEMSYEKVKKKKNPNFFSLEFPTDQHENFCHICMCSVPFSTEYFQSFHMGRRYLKSGPPCKTLRDLATNFYHLLGFARNLASES
jgi:hypothetical protein